jgi:signal transduction histidine kinase
MRGLEEMCGRLRTWPRQVAGDYRTLSRECAEAARELFDAEKVILAFTEGDEPWLMMSAADARGTAWREEAESDIPLVDDRLGGWSFLYAPEGQVLMAPDGTPSRVTDAIHPLILAEHDEVPVLSIPVESEDSRGRLFVFRPRAETAAMLAIADAVGTLVSMRFEATAQRANGIADAVRDERERVARDLHDGLLQSFTGVVLQLETVHKTLDSKPADAQRMITDAQALIMSDQRELRRFVEELRPRKRSRDAPFDFPARLEDLRNRFATQWGIALTFDVERIEPFVGAFLGQETFRLIHEAVTNAAKHARASDVRVGVRVDDSVMRIEVADNGTGFAFQGRLTLEELREKGLGPTVLAERVHSLNGHLVVDSTDTGSTVTISIPLGWGGSANADNSRPG